MISSNLIEGTDLNKRANFEVVLKSSIRKQILEKLKALSRIEKMQQSKAIEQQLKSILTDELGLWVAYKNLSDEPEIQWDQVSTDIRWAFPKIKNDTLEFYKDSEMFTKSELGFAEPINGTRVGLDEIQGCILPGLAFDKKGYRLGRGKGFYDRALSEYKGTKIGVCFKTSLWTSLCEELPHEPHDVRCDQIVTENQIFKVMEV